VSCRLLVGRGVIISKVASRTPAEIARLRAEADHATERLALYRRRMNLGRGDPRRLAELQRVADGAAKRLREAQARAD
jgi:hypothetical protein